MAETKDDAKTDCTKDEHYARLTSGDWDERAGGALHCPVCGEQIGAFRQ